MSRSRTARAVDPLGAGRRPPSRLRDHQRGAGPQRRRLRPPRGHGVPRPPPDGGAGPGDERGGDVGGRRAASTRSARPRAAALVQRRAEWRSFATGVDAVLGGRRERRSHRGLPRPAAAGAARSGHRRPPCPGRDGGAPARRHRGRRRGRSVPDEAEAQAITRLRLTPSGREALRRRPDCGCPVPPSREMASAVVLLLAVGLLAIGASGLAVGGVPGDPRRSVRGRRPARRDLHRRPVPGLRRSTTPSSRPATGPPPPTTPTRSRATGSPPACSAPSCWPAGGSSGAAIATQQSVAWLPDEMVPLVGLIVFGGAALGLGVQSANVARSMPATAAPASGCRPQWSRRWWRWRSAARCCGR